MATKISTFKDRLLEAMDFRRINQETLAKETSINKTQISRYVNGKALPMIYQVDKIAKYLRVDPTWLMGYNVPMFELVMAETLEQNILMSDKIKDITSILAKMNESDLDKIILLLRVVFPSYFS